MLTHHWRYYFYTSVSIIAFFVLGCGYSIKYGFNKDDINVSETSIPMNIRIATFSDNRDDVEREESARKKTGVSDHEDYSYNNGFRGNVDEEITKTIIRHLNYSKIFSGEVEKASFGSEQLSPAKLDSLNKEGVDAVMIGEIKHFYGFYPISGKRYLLYYIPLVPVMYLVVEAIFNPDVTFGQFRTPRPENTLTIIWELMVAMTLADPPANLMESSHEKPIESRTKLNAKLISTATHQQIWEDSSDVFIRKRAVIRSMDQTTKYKLAVQSLRDAVNKVIPSLENAFLKKEKLFTLESGSYIKTKKLVLQK